MKLNNLTVRILTALVGIPIILVCSILGGLYFLILIMFFTLISQLELYHLFELKGAKPQKILGVVLGLFLVTAFFHNKIQYAIVNYFETWGYFIPFPSQAQLIIIILLLSIIIIFLVELFRNNGSAIINISSTLMGIIYIALFMGTFVGLRELFNPNDFPVSRYFNILEPFTEQAKEQIYFWGGKTIVSIFGIIWICDSAAYFVGMILGKNKLFERVSPKKTWEGAIAGFVFAIISSIAAKYLLIKYLTLSEAIVIGLVVGIFGQLADLSESLLKRDSNVKDSSKLIPGHGGFLDRFDSLLLIAPILFLYFDFILFS